MSAESAPGERVLTLSSVASEAERPVALPRPSALRPRIAVPVRVVVGPVAARIALAAMVLGTFALVAFASSGPTTLVPRSNKGFPGWEAGPLHLLFNGLPNKVLTLSYGLSVLLAGMTVAYGIVLAAGRVISTRAIVISVLALHAILLLSPPLGLNDVFNYLGYARLGGYHDLNPYTHVIAGELHDPVYPLATWHGLSSPYGPLFTAATYLLPLSSLAVSYWLLKTVTVLASLVFLALVWQCARQLGRDPRIAVAFVALNPIYIVFALGGFHNDFFMLVPMLASIALLTGGTAGERVWRDRGTGAVLMLAVAIKFTAILLLPFLLAAVWSQRQRVWHVLQGSVLAALPLAALSLALFGPALPNLQDQSTLLTQFSIPNVVGLALGIGGGTPTLLTLAKLGVIVLVVVLLRRRGDWVSHAGWATLALIASLAWLMPWYVIWVLPLAALGLSSSLRRATLALTVFVVVTFLPALSIYMADHNLSTMNTAAGRASVQLENRLKNPS